MHIVRHYNSPTTRVLAGILVSFTYSLLISNVSVADKPLYLSLPAVVELIKWAYVCQVFCVMTPMLGRIAVTLYTLNLLEGTRRYLRWSLWFLLFWQTMTNISLLITLLTLCGVDMVEVAK